MARDHNTEMERGRDGRAIDRMCWDGYHLVIRLPNGKMRCPECGNEDQTEMWPDSINHMPAAGAHEVSAENIECLECGQTNDGWEFYNAHMLEHTSDEEIERLKEQSERYGDMMADHQHTAEYLSQKRESVAHAKARRKSVRGDGPR